MRPLLPLLCLLLSSALGGCADPIDDGEGPAQSAPRRKSSKQQGSQGAAEFPSEAVSDDELSDDSDAPSQTAAPKEPSQPAAKEPSKQEPQPQEPSPKEPQAQGSGKRPVLLFHGFWGESAEFEVLKARLVDDGWPAQFIYLHDFQNTYFGCNTDNAKQVAQLVDKALSESGAGQVDIIAHSMGSLATRHYIRNMGGLAKVNTWISLGGPNHGVANACTSQLLQAFNKLPPGLPTCAFDEMCGTTFLGIQSAFLKQLNSGDETPGAVRWFTLAGVDDPSLGDDASDGVIGNWSTRLEGATNHLLPGVTHSGPGGYMEHPAAYEKIHAALSAP